MYRIRKGMVLLRIDAGAFSRQNPTKCADERIVSMTKVKRNLKLENRCSD